METFGVEKIKTEKRASEGEGGQRKGDEEGGEGKKREEVGFLV